MKHSSAGRASSGTRGSKLPVPSGRSSIGTRSSIGSRQSARGSLLKKTTTYNIFQRPSTGGATSRRSSAYGRYGHEALKDPRPVGNKAYKDQSIKQLVEFLTSYNYPYELSPKMLVSPITRDFRNIFEFMFRFFDPNFKLCKPDDYIPMAFKRLRYPFQIVKTTMFSIGSPHTWPTLLAALTWLREILKSMSELDVMKELFRTGDFGDSNEAQYLFEYAEKSYKLFINGVDSYEEEEQELANKMRTCGEMADIDQNVTENHTLKEQLSFLQEQPDQLLRHKEMFDIRSLDLEKIREYNSTLDTHIQNKEEMDGQIAIELAETEAELQALLQDNERKEQIYESQEFSLTDVERLKMERQRLHGSIEAIETDIRNIEKQVWSGEVNMSKQQESLKDKIAQYTQAATTLCLIPASAEHAAGQDYDLTGQITSFEQEATKFVTIIKPGLLQLKKRVKVLVHQATDKCISETEAFDQMAELVAEKTQALVLLNTHQKRLDDNIENSKQAFAAEEEELLSNINHLQDCLCQLRKQSSHSLDEVQRQMASAKRQAKNNQTLYEKKESEYMSFLSQMIELVITHKGHIQKKAEIMRKQVKDAYTKDMECLQAQGPV